MVTHDYLLHETEASTFVNLSIPLCVHNYLNVIYNLRFPFWSDLMVSVLYSGSSSPASSLGWIWLGHCIVVFALIVPLFT